jgi:hypothetical protein
MSYHDVTGGFGDFYGFVAVAGAGALPGIAAAPQYPYLTDFPDPVAPANTTFGTPGVGVPAAAGAGAAAAGVMNTNYINALLMLTKKRDGAVGAVGAVGATSVPNKDLDIHAQLCTTWYHNSPPPPPPPPPTPSTSSSLVVLIRI